VIYSEDQIVVQEIDVVAFLEEKLNSEKLEFTTALAELIDNSLDANADHVIINVDQTQLTFWDNGKGTASPAAMCHYANSSKPKRKRNTHIIGRYGVGFKHASFLFCKEAGTTQVVSKHNGVVRRSSINWGQCKLMGKLFAIRDRELSPDEARAYLKNMCGTFIEFGSCPRPPFGGTMAALEANVKKLEETYAPALRQGRRIELYYKDKKKFLLCAPKDPVLLNLVEKQLQIGNKTAFLRAGLLQDPTCGKRGISLAYAMRVINSNCTDIVPVDYPTNGWWARVELDCNWSLSTNKLEVSDDDYELLKDAIWQAVKDIAEQAKESTNKIVLNAQLGDLTERLNVAMGVVGKAKRPNRHGEKREEPRSNIHRIVREATVVDGDGLVRRRTGKAKNVSAFTVEYANDPREEVSWAEGSRVYLNERFEVVQRAKADGAPMANDLLLSLAMYALAYSDMTKEGTQQKLWTNAPDYLSKAFAHGYSIRAAPKAATG
jgi:hypothetical protein